MKNRKRKKYVLLKAALLLGISVCSAFGIRNLYGEFGKSRNEASAKMTQKWELILVNDENKIPENYTPELISLDNGRKVDARIYPSLQEMFDDMRSENIYPVVGEGYRTAEEQEQMMKDKTEAYINEGYSRRRAEALAKNEVAQVGKSEHQLGLAVDINANKSLSTNEEVYEWLAENAYKYGFVMRYPADKTYITGIDYEPWHYRYVGKEAAEEMQAQGVCLEEYIGTLS